MKCHSVSGAALS